MQKWSGSGRRNNFLVEAEAEAEADDNMSSAKLCEN
jgi:hypothetical protein